MYIESWSLGYAFFSFSGTLLGNGVDASSMKEFLTGYQGLSSNQYFSGIGTALVFFVITFFVNFYFIYKGVQGGIERLSRIGMPLLLVLAVVLVVRVLTLGTPDPSSPELSVGNALGFVWNPDWSLLLNSKVWREAAGQIIFTLSVGIGVILTYASYAGKTKILRFRAYC
jgi:SNF family Na+-dependent transporter